MTAERRHQVTDIEPALAPVVTEYRAQAKCCPGCGATSVGELPGHVRARASYGPEAHAQAASLIAHHVPVYRSTILLAQLAGIRVSSGWMAGVRSKAAALVASSGFMDHVAALLRMAEAVHVDETPARAAGGTRYVHLACTRYLTHLHTGDRSAEAIDAGGVLPGYTGIIVRDGYKGYEHLTGALHAWCAVHILRDLKALHDFEPTRQAWAQDMAGLLIEARDADESEPLVSRSQGIAAGQAGHDCAPVAQHTGHCGSLGRRGNDADLGGRVGPVFLSSPRSVEDPRPCIDGVGEGQDFGRAFPGAPVNLDPLAFGQRALLRIAKNPHAVRSVPEGFAAVVEYNFG